MSSRTYTITKRQRTPITTTLTGFWRATGINMSGRLTISARWHDLSPRSRIWVIPPT